MSASSEDPNNLTTDAFPSAPRDNLNDLQNGTEENNEGPERSNSREHPTDRSRSNKNSDSDDSDHSCHRKCSSDRLRFSRKSCEGLPSGTNAFGNVINITNASGVQIGSNYTYIMKNTKDKYQKKNAFFPKTEQVSTLLNSKKLVTEDDLQFIAKHMDEAWMDTARKLDYSDGQISQFRFDHINSGLKEVIYQFLLDWFRNNGDAATVGKLTNALWNTGQRDCVTRWSLK